MKRNRITITCILSTLHQHFYQSFVCFCPFSAILKSDYPDLQFTSGIFFSDQKTSIISTWASCFGVDGKGSCHEFEMNLNWNFFSALAVSLIIIIGQGAVCSANLTGSTCKDDGYGVDYILPTRPCRKVPGENGAMVQTIPKLIPASRFEREASCGRQSRLGIPPGRRICRIPDCNGSPCRRGRCKETMVGYECHCPPGYTGHDCNTEILGCNESPCLNGGTCEDGTSEETLLRANGFSCICGPGWVGRYCHRGLFIRQLRLLGGTEREGILTFSTPDSIGANLTLVRREGWNANASDLLCRSLGFKGSMLTYITEFSVLKESHQDRDIDGAAAITCPEYAINITQCWHGTKVTEVVGEVIGVSCCQPKCCEANVVSLGVQGEADARANLTFHASSCDSNHTASHCKTYTYQGMWTWIPVEAWLPVDSWVTIVFAESYVIESIITRGYTQGSTPCYITSYTMSYGRDNTEWIDYVDGYSGELKVFPGNYDATTRVTNVLLPFIITRKLLIHPKTFHECVAFSFDLTGYRSSNGNTDQVTPHGSRCAPMHGEPLGVKDGRIPDSALTSSSIWGSNPKFSAHCGRLDGHGGSVCNAVWLARRRDQDKWVKIDLGTNVTVTGVIVQGRPYFAEHWVTSVFISYLLDGADPSAADKWSYIKEKDSIQRKIYPANFDRNTHVTIVFEEPIRARYVRIHPNTFHGSAAMRFEVLGHHSIG